MAAKKFLRNVAGRLTEVLGIVTSAGAANDGDIPALDATGKLDASLMPAGFGQNTATIQASEGLAANDMVNIHNVTGAARVRKADATTTGREANGFVSASVANGANATVYLTGNRITGLSGMTPGARQFLHTTAGTRNETPPSTAGNVVQVVGIAIDATTMIFEPEEPITVA